MPFKPGKSGNPKGRPKLAYSEQISKSMALGKVKLLQRLEYQAHDGDSKAGIALFQALYPKPKPQHEKVNLPALADPVLGIRDKVDSILSAIGKGEIAPDVGVLLIQALGETVRLIETDELIARIEALENDEYGGSYDTH